MNPLGEPVRNIYILKLSYFWVTQKKQKKTPKIKTTQIWLKTWSSPIVSNGIYIYLKYEDNTPHTVKNGVYIYSILGCTMITLLVYPMGCNLIPMEVYRNTLQ